MNQGDAKREQAKSRIYSEILGKIMRGEIAPGQRLVEDELARSYNVSRTPIREVLFALAKDGLVEHIHNRGAKVVSFTPDDVEEIYEIRKALECLSVRSAVRNLGLSELHEIERRLRIANRQDRPEWNKQQAEIDLELHRVIVARSGNRRLAAYLENISLLIHSLRLVGYRNDKYARQAGIEHLAIVQALLRRDAELAERLLSQHIDVSKRNALELFFQRHDESHTVGSAPPNKKDRRGRGSDKALIGPAGRRTRVEGEAS